jgi:hypothetical protein
VSEDAAEHGTEAVIGHVEAEGLGDLGVEFGGVEVAGFEALGEAVAGEDPGDLYGGMRTKLLQFAIDEVEIEVDENAPEVEDDGPVGHSTRIAGEADSPQRRRDAEKGKSK